MAYTPVCLPAALSWRWRDLYQLPAYRCSGRGRTALRHGTVLVFRCQTRSRLYDCLPSAALFTVPYGKDHSSGHSSRTFLTLYTEFCFCFPHPALATSKWAQFSFYCPCLYCPLQSFESGSQELIHVWNRIKDSNSFSFLEHQIFLIARIGVVVQRGSTWTAHRKPYVQYFGALW